MPKIDKELNTHYPLFDNGLYTEVVHQNGERAIKILTGKYQDVVYQYGNVNVIPREDSEIPTIDFERAVRLPESAHCPRAPVPSASGNWSDPAR